jgi:hypothetical protein
LYIIGLLQGDLCDAIIICADFPAEDKTCDKKGSFYKTLVSTFDHSLTFKNNVQRQHCIFSNRKVLKRKCTKFVKI